jgi:activator of HSP90 ATPase
MPLESLDMSAMLAAPPDRVYAAWLDGASHAAMTGSPATCDARPGGPFTAWDGYIAGTNLALEPAKRIVQGWRTSEFATSDADSRVEIALRAEGSGTLLRLVHTDIPEGQGQRYAAGWEDHYFGPMRTFFAANRNG